MSGLPSWAPLLILVSSFVIAFCSPSSHAHPLGNESITHIGILWVLPDRVEFDLFLDFAETPSQPYVAEVDANQDGTESLEEQRAWLKQKAADCIPLLTVTLDGRPIPLTAPDAAHDPLTGKKMATIPGLIRIPGVAGMPTYKTLIRFVGTYPQPPAAGEHVLFYEDATFGQYNGLRRIVLERVPSVEFIPPHPDFLDDEGTAFIYESYDPANLPQERRATIKFRIPESSASKAPASQQSGNREGAEQSRARREAEPGAQGPTTALSPPSPGRGRGGAIGPDLPYPILDPRNDPARTSEYNRQATHIIGLLQGRWGFMLFLTITALSFIWGAAHALMPGHAKTVVAAYLISRSGSYWHAVVLAIIVTITHTALVVILGLVISVYQATHPALGPNLQLWLGIIAGILVAVMGITLIWRAATGRIADHGHHHDHPHDHEPRSWLGKLFTHSHPHLEEQNAAGFSPRGRTEYETASIPAPHPHPHDHAHGHPHHHDHPHTHTHDQRSTLNDPSPLAYPSTIRNPQSAIPSERLTLRMLLLLGVTGGIVPCPTATIIMLLGISANVVAGALYAVGIFSLGLALTLMLIGFLALSSRRIAARILADAQSEGELSTTGRRILFKVIPALSGTAVVVLGLAIAANYAHHMLQGRALFGWLG